MSNSNLSPFPSFRKPSAALVPSKPRTTSLSNTNANNNTNNTNTDSRSSGEYNVSSKEEVVVDVSKEHRKSYDSSSSTLSSTLSTSTLEISISPPPNAAPLSENHTEVKNEEENMRDKIIEEIVDSELAYCSDLELMIGNWMKPIMNQYNLSPKEVTEIFSNIEAILSVHQSIAKELKIFTLRKDAPVVSVFSRWAPFLKLYTAYCQNQTTALDVVSKLEKNNNNLASFLEGISTNPSCRGLALEDFLIKPIQRITTYPLLFSQLLEYTNQQSDEYKVLVEFIKSLQLIMSSINDTNEKSIKFQELIEINERIIEYTGTLVNPTRHFLKEGKIYRLTGKRSQLNLLRKVNAQVMVMLAFTDLILYCKQSTKGILIFREELSFGNFRVADTPNDHPDHELAFLIEGVEGEEKMEILFTDTAYEKECWTILFATQTIVNVEKQNQPDKPSLNNSHLDNSSLNRTKSPKILDFINKPKEKNTREVLRDNSAKDPKNTQSVNNLKDKPPSKKPIKPIKKHDDEKQNASRRSTSISPQNIFKNYLKSITAAEQESTTNTTTTAGGDSLPEKNDINTLEEHPTEEFSPTPSEAPPPPQNVPTMSPQNFFKNYLKTIAASDQEVSTANSVKTETVNTPLASSMIQTTSSYWDENDPVDFVPPPEDNPLPPNPTVVAEQNPTTESNESESVGPQEEKDKKEEVKVSSDIPPAIQSASREQLERWVVRLMKENFFLQSKLAAYELQNELKK